MNPITKLNSFVFSISTSIVYFVWNELSKITFETKFINILLTLVVSISFYRLLYKLGLLLCEKNDLIKKLILGKNYFHGIWVGFYIYKDVPTLYYEIFDQTVEKLTITGRAFDIEGNYKESWMIVDPYINVEESKMSYYYETTETDNNSINIGFVKANIVFKKQTEAIQTEGFAIDSDDTIKVFFFDMKTNCKVNKIIKSKDFYNKELYDKAMQLYSNNCKHFIP